MTVTRNRPVLLNVTSTGQKKGNTGDGYVPQYYDDIVGCM